MNSDQQQVAPLKPKFSLANFVQEYPDAEKMADMEPPYI